MSRDESVGVQSQCARCDQARSCWIRDTLEGRDAPEPNAIAVEGRYVERAAEGECVFFRRPRAYISYKSRYDAQENDSQGTRRTGWTDYRYTRLDEHGGRR